MTTKLADRLRAIATKVEGQTEPVEVIASWYYKTMLEGEKGVKRLPKLTIADDDEDATLIARVARARALNNIVTDDLMEAEFAAQNADLDDNDRDTVLDLVGKARDAADKTDDFLSKLEHDMKTMFKR